MKLTKKTVLILSVVYATFISVFALDGLEMGPLAFVIHLVPSFVIVALAFFASKRPKHGGIAFLLLGTVFTFWFRTYTHVLSFLLISTPLFFLGTLFLCLDLKNTKKYLMYVFLGLVLSGFICFVASVIAIGTSVGRYCELSQRSHAGDCVESLIAYVSAEDHSQKERTRAIWALGQFADPRALPVLTELYTGEPCDHDNELCQYEVEKAIKWCSTNQNILAPIWRRLFL